MNNSTPMARLTETSLERVTVLTVDPTAHLTDEQKTWRKVKIVPSGTEGVGLLVPVETPDPVAKPVTQREVLSAVAEMLAVGYAGSAEAIFAKLRTSGWTLKTVVGEDGVLHVTVVGA